MAMSTIKNRNRIQNLSIGIWPTGAAKIPSEDSKTTLLSLLHTYNGTVIITGNVWPHGVLIGHGWYEYFEGLYINYDGSRYWVNISNSTVTYTRIS